MPDLDLIIYDLDGTLVESAPEICDAVNDVMRERGWPETDEPQVARWIGHGTGALLRHAVARATGIEADQLEGAGIMDEVGAAYDVFYGQRCGTRSRLYPGVRKALGSFRNRGIRQAIVTNKETRYTDRVLEIHGLNEGFERIIAGDTLATRKPHPAGIEACIDAAGTSADRTLFVGDSSIDVETARNAGVPVWVVPYGYNMGAPAETTGADRVIADFLELEDRIRSGAGRPDHRHGEASPAEPSATAPGQTAGA